MAIVSRVVLRANAWEASVRQGKGQRIFGIWRPVSKLSLFHQGIGKFGIEIRDMSHISGQKLRYLVHELQGIGF